MGCMDKSESTKASTTSPYTPQQRTGFKKALNVYLPTLGKGQNVYQGTRVAPLTAAQEQGIETAGSYLNYFSPITDSSDIPLYGETGSTLSNILSGEMGASLITPEQTEAYYNRVYGAPARKTWSEDILPATREAFAGPGYWGSARARGEMESAQDLADWLGTKRGETEWSVLQQNQALQEAKAGRALQAVSPALAYGEQPTQLALQRLGGLTTATGVVSMEQKQKQNEIDAAMQKFAEENMITDPVNMQILLSLLGTPYGGTTTKSKTVTPFDWGGAGLAAAFTPYNAAGATLAGGGIAALGALI